MVRKSDLIVPTFTAEDYTETNKPYEWLYSFRDNPFQLQQMIERVKAQAASVKIRGFMNLWNMYLKSMSGEMRPEGSNTTDFEGMPTPQQLNSGKYICNSDGVSVVDGFGVERVICPHPIAPIRRFKNVDSGEELLEIWYRRGTSEGRIKDETHIVPKDVIANGILGLAKYGVVVNKRNDKDLSAYLMDMEEYNYDILSEEKSVKRLGWVGEGYHDFSPYVKNIYFDGEDDFGGIFNSVKHCGSYDTWKDAIRSVRAEKTAARLYIASSFASVILKPCGLLPFLVHVWGGTGNGKSVLLMLATSIWANPEMGEYVATFNGTRYAQETRAGFLNNLPMCLDELQIQASQGVKDFDDIIYQLCEGVSKSQGKVSGGLRRQIKWRNVILSNGEHTIIKPLSGGGARNRVIEIEAPNKIYSDLVGICETITHNYGFAGMEFVNWLLNDDNMDRVKQLQKEYYHALLNHDVTEKQAGSASAILTADHIITELIFQDDLALTVDEMAEVLLRKGDIDVNQKTLEWLYDYVVTNGSHFEIEGNKSELWGKISEEEGLIYIIRSIFDRELKAHGLDSKAFLSWAMRSGKILPGRDGPTWPMKIPGTKSVARVIRLKMNEPTAGSFVEMSDSEQELPF
ncbi:MAG: DUF927 domain-containing protein [Clostridia bacterium]|nr:DUF927 domain-containing protein [Clostridia bacterium]